MLARSCEHMAHGLVTALAVKTARCKRQLASLLLQSVQVVQD